MNRKEYKQSLVTFYEDNLQATHRVSCELTDAELREIQSIRMKLFVFIKRFNIDDTTDS